MVASVAMIIACVRSHFRLGPHRNRELSFSRGGTLTKRDHPQWRDGFRCSERLRRDLIDWCYGSAQLSALHHHG